MTPSLTPLARAAILGAVTGIRSQTALALLARAAHRGELPAGADVPRPLAHPWAAPLTSLSLVGETVGDKLPFIPARTDPPVLVGRIGLGGIVGALTMRVQGADPVPGALVGAVAGGLLAVTATTLRRTGTARTGLPDLVFGLAEDALSLGAATVALPRR